MNLSLNGIVAYIKSLNPFLPKNELLENCRTLSATINSTTLPLLKQAHESLGANFKPQSAKVIIWFSEFKSMSEFGNREPIAIMHGMFENARDILEFLDEEIMAIAGEKIASEGISARTATVLRSLAAIDFASRFILSFLNHVFIYELAERRRSGLSLHDGNDLFEETVEKNTSPAQIEEIDYNLSNFIKTIVVVGKPREEFTQAVVSIPEVNFAGNPEATVAALGEHVINPLGFAQFDGPIYRLRLGWASFQMDQLDRNKKYMQVLQLRMQQLKLEKEKNPSVSVDAKIETVQKEIGKIEYKISKAEEGLK